MTDPHANEDWQALLRTIRGYPHDPLPRLVAADWLEENGHAERAEFVRVQCELAGMSPYAGIECKICGNTPDENGAIEHGRGCYTQSEDGGGTSFVDPTADWRALRMRETTLFSPTRDRWFPPPDGFGFDWDIRLAGEGDRQGWVIRNGFVDEIRCPWWFWCGGGCEACGATGGVFVGWDTNGTCPRCHGTGRTPAHGPAVVARHPVTAVVVTDRRPNPDSYGGGRVAWQSDPHERDLPSWLPYDVFRRLDPFTGPDGRSWMVYASPDAAESALSRALLDPLREAAGLPPLPPEVSQ